MRDARLTALHSVVFQMQLILPLAGSSPCRLYCSVIAVAVAVAVVDAVLLNLPSALPCGRRDGPGTVAYEDQQCQFEEKDPVLQRSSSALADQFEGSERIQHNGCRPARPLGAIFSSGSATDCLTAEGRLASVQDSRTSHDLKAAVGRSGIVLAVVFGRGCVLVQHHHPTGKLLLAQGARR